MQKSLTIKQNKFVMEFLLNGGNKVRAALETYDTTNYKTASKIADSNCKNPYIQERILQALEKNNISEKSIAQVIAEGLGAQRVIYNELTKAHEQLNYPDHAIQYKYLCLLIEILGLKTAGK